jgi:hypothetical protein
MPECVHRNQLVKLWDEAVLGFSQAVSRLKACHKNDRSFAEQYKLTELARQRADNARTLVELHRAEHGC